LFLFRFLNLNHLASLKLIRKICRGSLLRSTQVRAGQANTSAHNEDAHDAGGHGENVRPVSGTSTYEAHKTAILAVSPSQRPAARRADSENLLDVLRFAAANPSSGAQACLSYVDLLELVPKRKTILLGVSKRLFRFPCFSLPPPILQFGWSP